MTREKICGIYCIENIVNHKRYIGQSVNINNRWQNHKNSLRKNHHENIHLQNAWNKYGENNFIFYVIEKCNNNYLSEREIFWIEKYDTYQNGYNRTLGGDGGNTICDFSEDRLNKLKNLHSEKMKEFHKNRTKEFNSKLSNDEVLNIVIPRLLNNEFDSDIARDLNVSSQTINDIRKHRTWKKLTQDIEFVDISNRKRGRIPKKVNQYSKVGDFIRTFNSASEVGNEYNVDPKMIMDTCSGRTKSCRGYVWKYVS